MSPLEYSKARLCAVIEEINRLKEGEFPYEHARDALEELKNYFQTDLDSLDSFSDDKDPNIISTQCGETLYHLFSFVSLLGFIVRSTNIRNAFEVYGPLLRLAKQCLGDSTKLIFSSEWEFSPLTIPEVQPLPKFVLIGLPAPEAENPLVLPLAGHELGHAVWASHQLKESYYDLVEGHVFAVLAAKLADYIAIYKDDAVAIGDDVATLNKNISVKRTIAPAVDWAVQQAEEYFCDCIGLYLFDQAFLHAYAYLLSPKAACARSMQYPSTKARMGNLVATASSFRKHSPKLYSVPVNFAALFEDDDEPGNQEDRLLVSIADEAAKRICPSLIEEAHTILNNADVPKLDLKVTREILAEFKQIVPACRAGSLTNILNAAWTVFHTPAFWPEISDPRKRQKVLRELVLKNIELLEIEEIVA